MKVELADARMLGMLNDKGRALGMELQKTSSDFTTLFRAVCERNGLDPLKVAIDFDTGEVFERKGN